jgi:hypothetical protein
MRFALTAVLMTAAVVGAQDAPGGRYVSKEGGYSVRFPLDGDPKVKNMDVPGGMKMVMVGVEGKDRAYMVMHMAFPEGMLKAVPAAAILDGAAKGAVAKSGGTELSNKEITFGAAKLPGREVVIDKDGKIARTQIILADPKMFILVAGGSKEEVTGKTGDAFFKSFELTGTGTAAPKGSPATKKAAKIKD